MLTESVTCSGNPANLLRTSTSCADAVSWASVSGFWVLPSSACSIEYQAWLPAISAQAIQPLPIGPNCQTEPSCAMPKCALTAAAELLNRSTVVGCKFPTIVCMTTPIMAPDPQEPLLASIHRPIPVARFRPD